MQPFKYTGAKTVTAAIQSSVSNPNATYLAGGTNLVDLMKEGVAHPNELIDISALKLTEIKKILTGTNAGGVSIGGLAKNTETANHPFIRQGYPLLSQAILAGASAQIRNMATNGGNLIQRTRCPYFYDVGMPCNKRKPGSGCGAMEGYNRMHAIFGWSENCVAVHPSDMCIALAALDAVVKVQGPKGVQRSIPFKDFHRLPGDAPEKDNNLNMGEIITSIEIPKNNFAPHSCYLKIRDRASYAFALVSVAVAMEVANGRIKKVNITLGGVAHKPWRAFEAEEFLAGKTTDENNFKQAAEIEMQQAKPLAYNKFKIALGRQAIAYALNKALNETKT